MALTKINLSNPDVSGKLTIAERFRSIKTDLGTVEGAVNSGADAFNSHESAAVLPHSDGSVTAQKLADNAVISSKIADKAVNAEKIADSAITTEKIKDYSITTSKIAQGAVNNVRIANASVDERTIKDSTITLSKLTEDARKWTENGFYSAYRSFDDVPTGGAWYSVLNPSENAPDDVKTYEGNLLYASCNIPFDVDYSVQLAVNSASGRIFARTKEALMDWGGWISAADSALELIGGMENLTTANKSTIVDALNELKSDISEIPAIYAGNNPDIDGITETGYYSYINNWGEKDLLIVHNYPDRYVVQYRFTANSFDRRYRAVDSDVYSAWANIASVDASKSFSSIGSLSALDTASKTSVVSAINEVNEKASAPHCDSVTEIYAESYASGGAVANVSMDVLPEKDGRYLFKNLTENGIDTLVWDSDTYQIDSDTSGTGSAVNPGETVLLTIYRMPAEDNNGYGHIVMEQQKSRVGYLPELKTACKSDIVGAINELYRMISSNTSFG